MDSDALLDYQAVERELCRLPDVTAARIVVDATGRPAEVHILATPSKGAKQIVRDVQSVAVAVFGLELDRRIISVVQFEVPPLESEPDFEAPETPEAAPEIEAAEPAVRPAPETPIDLRAEPAPQHPNGSAPARATPSRRIVVDSVTAVRTGPHYSAQVNLRRGDDQAVGIAEGLMVSGSESRLVAAATIQALRQFESAAERADVEMATVVRLGEHEVAVASIIFLVSPYEEIVAGSAVVRSAGEHDAMVRAVLDATNRRLARLGRG